MPEGLQLPDGKPVDIEPVAEAEREFNRAMAADTNSESAPPKRTKPADADPASRPPRSRQRPGKNARAASKPAKPAPPPQSDGERQSGVQGLVQIGAAVCMLLDQRTPEKNIAFKADAITLANAADPIASAVVETAKHNQQFAAVVDKITAAGPYAALIGVGFQVGMQLAANHGVKAAQMMGALAPEDLVASVEQAQAA